MATLLELITEVQENVQDESFTQARITQIINRAIREIAGSSLLSAPLPYLETTSTVTTSTTLPYVAMPATYQRDLTYCYSAAQTDEVIILASLEHLRAMYPSMDYTGMVRHVAISASRLYYQHIPGTADTLTLHYYQFPTVLSVMTGSTADTCVPNCIPAHLHEKLIVSRTSEIIFSKIEDGIDGSKVNTSYHHKEYLEGMQDLNIWIGPKKRRPLEINDVLTGNYC